MDAAADGEKTITRKGEETEQIGKEEEAVEETKNCPHKKKKKKKE